MHLLGSIGFTRIATIIFPTIITLWVVGMSVLLCGGRRLPRVEEGREWSITAIRAQKTPGAAALYDVEGGV
jgi:hypothetical protein